MWFGRLKNMELIEDKNTVDKKKNTIRVRGGNDNPTDPVGLSRAILHVLEDNEYVKLETIGPKSLYIAMTAFRMASNIAESKQQSAVLVMRQSEYDTEINGKWARGICTRIFSIPVKCAV